MKLSWPLKQQQVGISYTCTISEPIQALVVVFKDSWATPLLFICQWERFQISLMCRGFQNGYKYLRSHSFPHTNLLTFSQEIKRGKAQPLAANSQNIDAFCFPNTVPFLSKTQSSSSRSINKLHESLSLRSKIGQ